MKMAFFTNVVDLQAALSACLTVRDWEMLRETVEIPENFIPLAFARLTELTVQELEVGGNILLDNRKCLERLQRRAARIVYSFKPEITTESILENLRWPPLTRSMEKHCVLLVNKCLVGEVPSYF